MTYKPLGENMSKRLLMVNTSTFAMLVVVVNVALYWFRAISETTIQDGVILILSMIYLI